MINYKAAKKQQKKVLRNRKTKKRRIKLLRIKDLKLYECRWRDVGGKGGGGEDK